ncbi:MAG: hypothetical protein IKQ82_01835 [Lentisphaeria bacterium]|nr:hypothetical protein [Lentisphaeria bacterium]
MGMEIFFWLFVAFCLAVLLPGLAALVVLAVQLYRNRNEEPWIRRRVFFLYLLMLAHMVLFPVIFLLGSILNTGVSPYLFFSWILLLPVQFIVTIIYLVRFRKWHHRGLRIATVTFAGYYGYLIALLAGYIMMAQG